MSETYLDLLFELLENGEIPDSDTINQSENELDGIRSSLVDNETTYKEILSRYTFAAVESGTDPRHIFDDTGRCIRCGEDAEEWDSECVEGWTQRIEQERDAARAELSQLRADLAAAERERDEARARVAELEANIIECDAMTNIDRKPRNIFEAELAIVRMASEGRDAIDHLSELEQSATLTPRRCVTCAQEAAREMRDNASHAKTDMNTDDVLGWKNMTAEERRMWRAGYVCGTQDMHDSIIALPLPSCDGCNPLKPEVNRHGCNCPCGGCDAQATKQDNYGVWWCDACYDDYMGIVPENEATR